MTRPAAALCTALCGLLASACHTDMFEQPKLRPLEESAFFADGSSARPPVPDTVPRGTPDRLPVPVTRDLLERGRERYDIACAPCHGLTGDGQGTVVRRGFKAPLSLHSDRMRALPAARVVAAIEKGSGAMLDMRAIVLPADRFAIAAYVRALQASQNASLQDVPPEARAGLESQP
jgi:hypothetical protein